ncbi:DUF1016 N-terminal domain-containing protein [Singulisphaera rosea]
MADWAKPPFRSPLWRACPYGGPIISAKSRQFVAEYGRGFTCTALTRMIGFFEAFPDEPIVATLSQQLSWSHITKRERRSGSREILFMNKFHTLGYLHYRYP